MCCGMKDDCSKFWRVVFCCGQFGENLMFYAGILKDVDSMVRYVSPVDPAVYPHLAIILVTIGLFFMAWFFVYPF